MEKKLTFKPFLILFLIVASVIILSTPALSVTEIKTNYWDRVFDGAEAIGNTQYNKGTGFNFTANKTYSALYVIANMSKVGSPADTIAIKLYNGSGNWDLATTNARYINVSSNNYSGSQFNTTYGLFNFTIHANIEAGKGYTLEFVRNQSTQDAANYYKITSYTNTGAGEACAEHYFNGAAFNGYYATCYLQVLIYGTNDTEEPGGAGTITITEPSTPAGVYYIVNNNSVMISTTVTDFNPTNTTHHLKKDGAIYQAYSNLTNGNFTNTFNDLEPATYTAYATANNGTSTLNTTERTIIIYNFTSNITRPIDKENVTRYLNITYTDSVTPTGTVYISTHNITALKNGSLNFTINSNTNTTNFYTDVFNRSLTIGNYTLQIKTRDNYSNEATFTKEFILTRDAQLNVTLKYALGDILGNYTLNLTDETTGITETYNTPGNITDINIIKGRSYTLTADKTGYAVMNYTGVSFTENYNNYTFYLYTENSVLINIYDEATLTLINNTAVSITFTNNLTALSYTTNNGTYYKEGLTDGAWEVKFYSANYSYRTYTITVYNRSFQTLNAYLVPSTYTCVFTIRNSLNLAALEDVSFTAERLSNATWVTVESKYSDISGNVQIGFLPGIEYRFTLSKTGYNNKVFNLNPIIFNSYNVYIDPTASLNNTLEYGLVNIVYYPKTFYNNRVNNITFTITSPEGILTGYGISAKAPGGNDSETGSNAIGGSFILSFNITNATLFDRVNITYNYTSTLSGIHRFQFQHEIIGAGNIGNYTIANLKNRDYGLGTFEKVLLVMIGLSIITGLTYALAGLGGALTIGLITLNISAYLGFLPFWSVIIPDILGIVIIIAVSTGGNR